MGDEQTSRALVDVGWYRTVSGDAARVTEVGCFAYGYVLSGKGRKDEMWTLDDGHVCRVRMSGDHPNNLDLSVWRFIKR